MQTGGSLINAGMIANALHAVYLPNGGFVSNASNGTITFGQLVGIKGAGAAGTVVNGVSSPAAIRRRAARGSF